MRTWEPGPRPPGQTAEQFPAWIVAQLRRLALALASPGPERVGGRTVTASGAVEDTDSVVRADATGAPVTLTLPPARTVLGQRFVVKRLNASANAVTIAASSGETIDGAATTVLSTQYARATLVAWQAGTTFGYDLL